MRYERPIADSVLSDDERVEGICLSCRAVPLTNVVVELQEGDRLRRVLGFLTTTIEGNTMSKVMRLGYVHLRVTDLEEARNHYSNTLGMEVVASEPGKLYLKCWDEWDHHSLVLEEGGVGLVKLGYKVESPEAMTEFESRAQRFGVTTGRFSAGENLTVGEGVRITLPSEHNIELYTEMEYAGTETGAINPEAWPRNVRGVGTHWIDHALMPCEDPGLNERFLTRGAGLQDRRAGGDQHGRAGGDRHLDDVWGVAARHRVHQGPEREAAPLRLPLGGLEQHSAGG